jgi:predicted XRE-type DNA-binding protein
MSFMHSKKRARKLLKKTSKSRASDSKSLSAKNDDLRKGSMVASGGSIFDDLGFPPAEAMNLRLRSQLMIELRRMIEHRGLSQAQAAKLLGVTQPRISNLMGGKINLFSLDHLVTIAARAGAVVRMSVARSAA